LPSVAWKTLGKQESLKQKTPGKQVSLPSVFSDTRQTSSLPSIFFSDTQQRRKFA